ncbi:MAG: cytochrome c biogenesis heme-transporting ATPase CcmA [Granulosicoccaceae bacterium]
MAVEISPEGFAAKCLFSGAEWPIRVKLGIGHQGDWAAVDSTENEGLEVCELACFRGEYLLFQQLSFVVQPGDVVQIEGGNGRGKTTLLRILAGLGVADDGEVRWNGVPMPRARADFYAQLSWVGHRDGIKDELTPIENLVAAQALSERARDVDYSKVLKSLGLHGRDAVACRSLSAGQRRRVALARLAVSDAKVWILDEPLTALDVAGRERLQEMMTEHALAGGMVIYTTHQRLPLDGCNCKSVQLG